MSKRIVFDYYIDNGKLDHVFIRQKVRKVLIISFHISLRSQAGFYTVNRGNQDERDEFFSMMNPTFVMSDGYDCITEQPQYVYYFALLPQYRPEHNNTNIGIFSTIVMFQNILGVNILEKFMDFPISEYNYMKTNIYRDYLELEKSTEDRDEIETKKEYVTMAIRKYCHLHFLINFLVAMDDQRNKDVFYYYTKYLCLMRMLCQNTYPTPFFEKFFKRSFMEFATENDIYKLTAYKYIPCYLNCKKLGAYDEILQHVPLETVRDKIVEVNSIP